MRTLLFGSALTCTCVFTSLVPDVAVAGFFEDSEGRLLLRNYYFDDENRDGGNDRREWAQGFIFKAQSGFTEGPVGFGLDALGLSGFRLDSSPAHAGTGLLPVHDDGSAAREFSSMGLTAKMRWNDLTVSSGTLLPRIPVVVSNDGRLLPQTFRGTQVEYKGIDKLYLHAGHLDEFKLRNSSDSTSIYPYGYSGDKGSDFDFFGLRYDLSKELSLSSYRGVLRDFYQQQFFGAVHTLPIGPGKLISDLRYFKSDDDGAAYNGKVNNETLSGLFTYRLGGHSLGYGYQKNGGSTALPHIAGSTVYSFSTASVSKFIQPGEHIWMVRYDYDFAAAGVPGLTFVTRYYEGHGGESRGKGIRENELDTQLKYVVQSGLFKGVGAEVRHAVSRSNYASDWDSYRLYLTYDLLLW